MRKQIIRQVDETGRIVLPKPFREMLGLEIKDEVILSLNGDAITVRKFSSSCAFCGEDHAVDYKGVLICADCAKQIGDLVK
ncbi:MAG: AbrB/MazE/SpoVT family DNA-binding domain-containing protein [Clostridia bacterium]|nr:AbrB/MazE/SpoVT family DNA-binding domain-containing protein [Clostridia bacterium]